MEICWIEQTQEWRFPLEAGCATRRPIAELLTAQKRRAPLHRTFGKCGRISGYERIKDRQGQDSKDKDSKDKDSKDNPSNNASTEK